MIIMAKICEHAFITKDVLHPDYSLTEYDLYARLNMTIRKNLKTNKYEIAKIIGQKYDDSDVQYSFSTLEEAVKKANKLENANNTVIECGIVCPLHKHS